MHMKQGQSKEARKEGEREREREGSIAYHRGCFGWCIVTLSSTVGSSDLVQHFGQQLHLTTATGAGVGRC